jgi:hypothetical protein
MAGVKQIAVIPASTISSGIRLPLTRGRPGLPVGGGASSYSAASARSRVVTVTWVGRSRSVLPA